ncbi:hypothetical protein M3P21_20845 [Ruegeria sp. 2012CJ41-6]|uniref:Uncharacterized protein n=1 Tax=Ruegeria spongiae TaxID=2942209 RepID=A0ABT0Q7W5_9RHOB|nr:hypothetical protein [Ruegeria spongiae]MCL6285969.1 hypothetical protein [Ruegeria spongiae]
MAKRLHAMLDLESDTVMADSRDLHDLVDRIQSAAGPVASVSVPLNLITEAADALYRTRTLVATSLHGADWSQIEGAVSNGIGEIEIDGSSDLDAKAIVALAQRRNVKFRVDGNDDILKEITTWSKVGVRFAVIDQENPIIPDILKKISNDGLKIGLKFRGCSSFEDCCNLYESVAELISEGWIWPGSVRFSAGPSVQDQIVEHLRSTDLSRPQGCGVRPNPV